MPNRYYLIKILTNTQEQDASSVSMFDTLEKAQVAYHQTLAMYHNADDVLYAIVSIVDGEYSNLQAREIVDHRPTPNSEPEEE